MTATPTFAHILVLAHPQVAEATDETARITQFLEGRGVQAERGLLYDEALRRRLIRGEFDLLIALGGDGTMLRAGHLCAPVGVPILGINLGRFGFLTEVNRDDWRKLLPRLFPLAEEHPGPPADRYWIERRMMLRAEHWRAGDQIGAWDVLNEVVVSRGHHVRPIHLVAEVDGRFLATYVADALIAATATGSTAYALAAGGPILPPELRNILLVAVAPHLSLDRAVVLSEGSAVTITVHTTHQAVFSADGQAPIGLEDGDRIQAFAGEHTAQFVRFQDPGYFYRNLTPHMSQNPSTGRQR